MIDITSESHQPMEGVSIQPQILYLIIHSFIQHNELQAEPSFPQLTTQCGYQSIGSSRYMPHHQ